MTDALALYAVFLEYPLLTCLAVVISAVIVAVKS